MKKKITVSVLGSVALVGALTGIAFTARFDFSPKAEATTTPIYQKEGEAPQGLPNPPPIQKAALFSGAPESFAALAEKVGSSVVNINTSKTIKRRTPGNRGPRGVLPRPGDPFGDDFFENFFQAPQQSAPQKSLGSGFIINSDGYILTNNHVIEGADEIQVQLDGKKKVKAKIVGTDPKTDIAVIKIEQPVPGLNVAILGDSDKLRVGDWAMAVGNPFGLDHTVTAGIISAKGRVIGAGPYDDFIQTDASINPGNSGGPLFNMQGEVIGVNSAIVASGQGIGFAIPINMAKDLIPQLIEKGRVTRAWLGVGIQDLTPELAKSFSVEENGALISNVFPGSPADKGGIRSGDIVVSFNGKIIHESHELPALVGREPVGKSASLKVLREGKPLELTVTLGEMEKGEKLADNIPTSNGPSPLGLSVRDLTPDEKIQSGIKEGVVVIEVDAGSRADSAGIQNGDALISINNIRIASAKDFGAIADKIKTGEMIRILVRRGESSIFLAFSK